MLLASSKEARALHNQQLQVFSWCSCQALSLSAPFLHSISYFLRLQGGERERESLSRSSLLFLPSSISPPFAEMILLLPCASPLWETIRDHVIKFLSFESVLQRHLGGVVPAVLSAALSGWLCTHSLDSTGHGAALLLQRHLHSQRSLMSTCLFYLFQEAQAGGPGWEWGRLC